MTDLGPFAAGVCSDGRAESDSRGPQRDWRSCFSRDFWWREKESLNCQPVTAGPKSVFWLESPGTQKDRTNVLLSYTGFTKRSSRQLKKDCLKT